MCIRCVGASVCIVYTGVRTCVYAFMRCVCAHMRMYAMHTHLRTYLGVYIWTRMNGWWGVMSSVCCDWCVVW